MTTTRDDGSRAAPADLRARRSHDRARRGLPRLGRRRARVPRLRRRDRGRLARPLPSRPRSRPRRRSSNGSGTSRTSTARSPPRSSRRCSRLGSAARRRSSATRAPRRSRRRSSTRARRPGKPGVVALEGSFHGRTLGALSVTGQPGKRDAVRAARPRRALRSAERRRRAAVAAVDDEVGLILLEPILGEGGVVPLDREFVAAAAELAAAPLLRRGADRSRADGIVLRLRAARRAARSRHAREGSRQRPAHRGAARRGRCGRRLRARRPRLDVRRQPRVVRRRVRRRRGDRRGAARRTCSVEARSSPRRSRRFRACVSVRGRGLLLGVEVEACRGGRRRCGCASSGLLVLTAGENVVRLAPPLTVTARDVDDALQILDRIFC